MENNNDKSFIYCRRCGRKLKNDKYKKIGYGPVCLKKLQIMKETKPLFTNDHE